LSACFPWASQDRRLAYWSSLVLCASPATPFFLTVYTEGLYAALLFTALWLWYSPGGAPAALPFLAAAAACRSNGILNCIFPLARLSERLVHRAPTAPFTGRALAGEVLLCALTSASILSPYVAFQYHGYRRFCLCQGPGPTMCEEPGDPDWAWCRGPLPNMYSFVQARYWDVGLLRYYQLKQLPNFLLAVPTLLLTAGGLWRYWGGIWRAWVARAADGQRSGGAVEPYQSSRTWAMHVLWAGLGMFILFCANVQVS
jgi:GPI mannosyltransferase 2